ncbi:MAG: ATP-binding cassette domain-containing protein [Hyphomicrobiaceae bacterium]|nr:ATP-binding cassette domain-containing protein [Hyphomicrobiaceae bacterium]
MAAELLALKDIHLTFGSIPLLEGAELSVGPGDRICLVGRNGSGKSTLLKIAAGQMEPDRGSRFAHPSARIAYLSQEADLSAFTTTLEAVVAKLGPADDEARARALLGHLGFTGDEPAASLSGGEARRAAIAQVLAASPDVLLLDEPTNHLDLPTIEWLEGEILQSTAAIVLISHDRRFLERLSRTTVWLDRGRTWRLDRGFSGFEAWRDERLAEEEAERHKLDRKIARENEWMHGGVTARRKRNVRRVAELAAMRQQRREARKVEGNVVLEASEAGASGRLVIEAKGISKSFDGRPIVADLSIRIGRGDRVGLVGPNGAGKTTLISLLTGALQPDAGTVRLGTALEIVTLDQRREELRPDWTITEALTGGRGDQVIVGGRARHVASYMKDFLFTPEQMRTPLRVLSGGERGRLMLARALAKPSNLLVLDEPTNDLDLETLDLLQELLADYQGTVLLVSHDRDFLDRLVTSVLAAEGDGQWVEYAGGYSDMLAQRRGRDLTRTSAAAPRRSESRSEPAAAPQPGAPAPRRKLSFKDKHALESLPAAMAGLEKEIAALTRKLASADLFTRDPKGFAAATERLGAAQAELAAAEERWLELEMLREDLEGRE